MRICGSVGERIYGYADMRSCWWQGVRPEFYLVGCSHGRGVTLMDRALEIDTVGALNRWTASFATSDALAAARSLTVTQRHGRWGDGSLDLVSDKGGFPIVGPSAGNV